MFNVGDVIVNEKGTSGTVHSVDKIRDDFTLVWCKFHINNTPILFPYQPGQIALKEATP
jgi:hypothetical protein